MDRERQSFFLVNPACCPRLKASVERPRHRDCRCARHFAVRSFFFPVISLIRRVRLSADDADDDDEDDVKEIAPKLAKKAPLSLSCLRKSTFSARDDDIAKRH